MSSIAEIAAGTAVELFLAALGLGVLYRVWGHIFAVPQRQAIQAFQRGVVLHDGKVEKVLTPGRYWIMPSRTLMVCDMRAKPFQVPAQEVLTTDGMGFRMSLGGEYRIADPAAFVTESSDSFGSFYLDLRQALHAAIGELGSDAVLMNRQTLTTTRVKELLLPRAAQLGIEMTQLELWEAVPLGWLRKPETQSFTQGRPN
jgi:regulator of protease activity HflC (stomatin/prohibitin superfamily)